MSAPISPASGGGAATAPRAGGLLRAELRRLRLRRLLLLLVAGFLVLLLGSLVLQFLSHSRDDASSRARAEALAVQEREFCLREQQDAAVPPEARPPSCELSAESYDLDPRYDVGNTLPAESAGAAGVFAMLAFILGASAIGAEWSARTLSALLVWEPRRLRVLSAKLAALLLGVSAVAAGTQLVVIARGSLTGWLRGTFANVPAAPGNFWAVLSLQAGRGVLLALATATLGFALGTLLRSTAAALGLAFGYFAGGEILLRAARESWTPWLLSTNIDAWLEPGGLDIQLLRPGARQDAAFDPSSFVTVNVSNAEAGLYLLALVLVLFGAAAVTFARRDLT
jgi:ABC-type transport system involved in multi-copper enzyme maturation permease subunit